MAHLQFDQARTPFRLHEARNPFREQRRIARRSAYAVAAGQVLYGLFLRFGLHVDQPVGFLWGCTALTSVILFGAGALWGVEAVGWMRRAGRRLGRAGWMGLSVALYAGAIGAWMLGRTLDEMVR